MDVDMEVDHTDSHVDQNNRSGTPSSDNSFGQQQQYMPYGGGYDQMASEVPQQQYYTEYPPIDRSAGVYSDLQALLQQEQQSLQQEYAAAWQSQPGDYVFGQQG